MSGTTAMIMGLLLLLGACGKSAQVPLQSWLLDAMEGPTPVSALIHAATMVTAGVYLITRSNAIYAESPAASTAVVVVGTVTLLFGPGSAVPRTTSRGAGRLDDVPDRLHDAGRRIGPAGYAFAIFLLLTHGFFKADMFLGAGSVMHATNDEVDMRRYGALSRIMPITFVTFAAGYLAIIGFPFFSGFYSKDHIIEVAFQQSAVIGGLAMLGAGITAFYMTRLMLMTFLGQQALAGRRPSARVATGDDRAVDLLGYRVGDRRVGAEQLDRRLARSRGGRRSARGAARACSTSRRRAGHAGRRRHRCRDQRWLFGPRREIPVTQPESQSFFTGRTQRSLRRCLQRSSVHASRAAAHQRLVRARGRRNRRHGERYGRGHRRHVITAASGAERLRPLLRAHHDVGAAIVGVVIVLGRLG